MYVQEGDWDGSVQRQRAREPVRGARPGEVDLISSRRRDCRRGSQKRMEGGREQSNMMVAGPKAAWLVH